MENCKNEMLPKRERIVELDLLRAIAFIFVLVQHTIGGYSISPKASLSSAVALRFIYAI